MPLYGPPDPGGLFHPVGIPLPHLLPGPFLRPVPRPAPGHQAVMAGAAHQMIAAHAAKQTAARAALAAHPRFF